MNIVIIKARRSLHLITYGKNVMYWAKHVCFSLPPEPTAQLSYLSQGKIFLTNVVREHGNEYCMTTLWP